MQSFIVNPLDAELNPVRHLLALVGAHHILHVSRVRVNHHFINTRRNSSMFRPLKGYLQEL